MTGGTQPPIGESTVRRKASRGKYGLLIRLVVAVVLLAWIFHDIRPGPIVGDMMRIRWEWVAVAVAFDIMGYICQGIRWSLLLGPAGGISWFRSTRAVYAGLFANEILPMRLGELVRAYMVSRWMRLDFKDVIPSVAVERLLDGIWLALAIGLVTMFIPLPGYLVDAADILGFAVCVLTCLFLFLAFRKKSSILRPAKHGGSSGPFALLSGILDRLVSGVGNMGRTGILVPAFLVSLGLLVFQTAAFWLVMIAYGMNLNFWAGAAVFLIVQFGTAIPNAPSNIGSYQFFTVLGLMLFGTDKTTAAGFSLAVFIILTIPLWLIGFVAISASGFSLGMLRTEIGRMFPRARGSLSNDVNRENA